MNTGAPFCITARLELVMINGKRRKPHVQVASGAYVERPVQLALKDVNVIGHGWGGSLLKKACHQKATGFFIVWRGRSRSWNGTTSPTCRHDVVMESGS